jgi:choline dehydrogenase-like flavoprotein
VTQDTADIAIVGSGMGGATIAAGLAASGAHVTILERGEQIADGPTARDARAIFVERRFRPDETWRDGRGTPFNPGNYYPGFPGWIGSTGPKAAETLAEPPIPSFTRRVRQAAAT